jgi:predicted DNA-binding transcriptional regulator YafY
MFLRRVIRQVLIWLRVIRKPDDLSDEEIPIRDETCRQITRKVWSAFWLEREILRYGDSAVLLSPEPLRSRLRHRLIETLSRYDVQ